MARFILQFLCATLFFSGAWAVEAPATAPYTTETAWCVIAVAAPAETGKPIDVSATIKAGAVSQAASLRVDMHKHVGTTGRSVAGHAKTVEVVPNEAQTTVATFEVPADATALAFVVYVLPAGKTDWKDSLHATELAVPLKK